MYICVYIYIYIYTYIYISPNHPANIVDFGGFDSSIILNLRGGILMSIGGFPGKFESSNVSRDNVRREIGRKPLHGNITCYISHIMLY